MCEKCEKNSTYLIMCSISHHSFYCRCDAADQCETIISITAGCLRFFFLNNFLQISQRLNSSEFSHSGGNWMTVIHYVSLKSFCFLFSSYLAFCWSSETTCCWRPPPVTLAKVKPNLRCKWIRSLEEIWINQLQVINNTCVLL